MSVLRVLFDTLHPARPGYNRLLSALQKMPDRLAALRF